MSDPAWVLDHAPETPFMDPRRAHPPGVSPLDPADWIVTGPDFAAQMAERERLLRERREIVTAAVPGTSEALGELLETVLLAVAAVPGFSIEGAAARRPDGGTAVIDRADPLGTLGRLVAEDFCLLLPGEEEMVLGAALLCFPSRWLLSEKIGRALTPIHAPVPGYAGGLAPRVNRIFAAVRSGRPLCRVNWLVHATPELHLPLGREEKRAGGAARGPGLYLRTERQSILRLAVSGAAVFSIRTRITPLERLTAPERQALDAALARLPAAEIAYRGGADLADAARRKLRG